jgi:hypothetical protein
LGSRPVRCSALPAWPVRNAAAMSGSGEHGIGGGLVPDLRASNFLSMDSFYFIIHRANRDKAAPPH